MCWGFSHGNGWLHLIDGLCSAIQHRIDNPPHTIVKTLRNYLGYLWNKTVWNWLLYPILNKCKYNFYKKCYIYLNYNVRYTPTTIPQVVANQVKEKFGGLRFYYSGGDEVINGMVIQAENLSLQICEKCGVMNELVTQNSKGWIQTTCSQCSSIKDKRNHTENQNKELVKIFQTIRKEKTLTPKEEMQNTLKIIETVKTYK